MSPQVLTMLLLGAIAVASTALGYLAIWLIRRSRKASKLYGLKTGAAHHRLDTSTERSEFGTSVVTVPDRFAALDGLDTGDTSPDLRLTAELLPGDLGSALSHPHPPFDTTNDALVDGWSAADRKRRRAIMLAGYLSHPLPRIRVEALQLLSSNPATDPGLPKRIALLLLEEEGPLRNRASRITWSLRELQPVVTALHERDDAASAGALPRAYEAIENDAPRGRRQLLARAFGRHHAGGAGDEADRIAELIGLYAPDRAAERAEPAVAELGRRLASEDAEGALKRATEAVHAARGTEAVLDLHVRWREIGSWAG